MHSFSDCHIIVTSKILPQIDRYAESSAEVWNHARLWLGFLEAASAPSLPTEPRIRPPSRWRAREMAEAAAAAERQEEQEDELKSGQHNRDHDDRRLSIRSTDTLPLEPDNDTNRRRISTFSLSPYGELPDSFLGSSPGQMPSSPTPNRRKSQQSLARMFSWEDNDQRALSTPVRDGSRKHVATSALSTTPKDKPDALPTIRNTTSFSSNNSMPNPFTSQSNGTPRKGVRVLDDSSRGMVVLDLDQDYQDVITPPKTIPFAVPESKVATTPRAVLEKSKVDKIFMKDGLIVPRPIFTRLDDESDANEAPAATSSQLQSQPTADIGESKKRRREGDHHGPESVDGDFVDMQAAVAWDQGNRSNSRGKAVASPRKIANTRSIFSSTGVTNINNSAEERPSQSSIGNTDDEEHAEDGSLSPSSRLMESLREQSRQEEQSTHVTPDRNRAADVDDPILASLKTPPELRQNLLAYKTRMSLLPQTSKGSTHTTSEQQHLAQASRSKLASQPKQTSRGAETATDADTNRSEKQTTSSTSSTTHNTISQTAPDHYSPVVTSIPVSTSTRTRSATSVATSEIAARSFASVFAPATTSEGASVRRQTLALGTLDSSNNISQGTSSETSNSSNTRASLGGSVRLTNRPAFQAIQPPFSQLMSTPTIFSKQQFRRDIQPSPASLAAAAAIAATTAPGASSSQQSIDTSTPKGSEREQGQDRGTVLESHQQQHQDNTFSLTSTPLAGTRQRDNASVSDITQVSSRGIYSASRPATDDTNHSILTPFSRRAPPPAPRLGYYSDTLMTQSSLGLNHDGFGSYGGEEHTNTRTNMGSITGETPQVTMTTSSSSSNNMDSNQRRRMMLPPSVSGRISGSSSESAGGTGGSSSGIDTGGSHAHTSSAESQDTTSSFQIRSPCPPGRLGAGSTHQSLSLAALRRPPFSKP
ncbi:hypothetical protein BGW41_004366 [Actinomortierella wolfii]|nr:hypothetical protein BGW41_004366 [Actinomortierella wolfii]